MAVLVGLLGIIVLQAGRQTVMCGSDLPVVGIAACEHMTRGDRDSFFDAALGYSRAGTALAKQDILCSTAAAAAATEGRVRPGGYSRCMSDAFTKLRTAKTLSEKQYQSVAGYVSGDCRADLIEWRTARDQHFRQAREVAGYRLASSGAGALPQLADLSADVKSMTSEQSVLLATLKKVDKHC